MATFVYVNNTVMPVTKFLFKVEKIALHKVQFVHQLVSSRARGKSRESNPSVPVERINRFRYKSTNSKFTFENLTNRKHNGWIDNKRKKQIDKLLRFFPTKLINQFDTFSNEREISNCKEHRLPNTNNRILFFVLYKIDCYRIKVSRQ